MGLPRLKTGINDVQPKVICQIKHRKEAGDMRVKDRTVIPFLNIFNERAVIIKANINPVSY